ncbi:8221_t:CDS:1, partial [Scutellospora calospora]
MKRTSRIREGSKVTILRSSVGEVIAHPLLGTRWKTRRILATVIQPALSNNRWVIRFDETLEVEIEASAACMKFVTNESSSDSLYNEDNDLLPELVI